MTVTCGHQLVPFKCFHILWLPVTPPQIARRSGEFSTPQIVKIGAEIKADGAAWPLLKAGLFGGSLEQSKTAKTKFDGFLSEAQLRFF